MDEGRRERLTKRTIDALEHRASRYIEWDRDLSGYGVKVAARPSTTKTFVIHYRVGGGRRAAKREFKIGRYGKLTPEKAREEAEKAFALVELGKDPQADRAENRKTLTVAELCDLYLAEGVATKKASTVRLDAIRVAGHIRPLLGSRKITEIGAGDVERMMNAVATGAVHPLIPKGFPAPQLIEEQQAQALAVGANVDMVSLAKNFRDEALETGRRSDNWPAAWRDCVAKAISKALKQPKARGGALKPGSRVRGGKTAATKTVKLLRAIFNFAIARKLCAENPCIGVKTFADGKRERFLSPAGLGKLGDALTAAAAEGAQPHHVTIIRLLCLTGARKNEIARLRWSEVDDERGLLQLEDSKTGRKVIRLGAAAKELLSEVPRTKSPWVFPDPRDPSLAIRNLDWAWVGIRKRAGMPDLRIHDLRHSFASFGVAGGAGLYLVGKLLGHAHVATTSRYAHLHDDPLAAAADKISNTVAAALGGKSGDLKPMQDAG